MGVRRARRGLLLPLAAVLLAGGIALALDLTPEQVADVAPLGTPDGVVNAGDVGLALRIAAGVQSADTATLERGDVAPVTPLDPATTRPQRVRPNPNPVGPMDVGDVVVIARRAAGLIRFDRVNRAPRVALLGDGDLVSVSTYAVRGTVTDDNPLRGARVDLFVDGVSEGSTVPDMTTGTFRGNVLLRRATQLLTARAVDSEGRTGPLSDPVTVVLDRAPPVLAITAPPELFPTRAPTVEVSGTASDEHALSVSVNGVDALLLPPDLWGATVALLRENENVLVATARDAAVPPNETIVRRTVVWDTTPPVLVAHPPRAVVNTATLVLSGTVSDRWGPVAVKAGGVDATVAWNAATGAGTWSAEVPVAAGANTYTLVAVDRAGNETVGAPLAVLGDFTPPVVTLLSSRWVRASPADVTLGFSEPVLVERVGALSYSPPLDVDDGRRVFRLTLATGANAIAVRVVDDAGNVTDKTVTVTLDQTPPTVVITSISNTAFGWIPAGGLENVITNAPSAVVRGTVADAVSGMAAADGAGVKVNGYDATVDAAAGTFVVYGVPLLPRANVLRATATDGAGNTATSAAVNVRRDAEGPVLGINFARGAFVSTVSPSPYPFNQTPLPARHYRGTADIAVSGTAADPYYTARTETLRVTLDGTPLAVTGSAPFATFGFVLPSTVLRTPGLHVLQLVATDSLGNQTTDVQSLLDGQWYPRNATIANAVGVAAGPAALNALEPMLEEQITSMNGDLPDQTIDNVVDITIHGIALCDPPGRPYLPPYSCTPRANVDLGLTSSGHVQINATIPTLYAGITTSGGSWWMVGCTGTYRGYILGSNVVVTLLADFVNTGTGVELQPVPGTVDVNIGSLTINTGSSGCNTWIDIAGWLMGGLTGFVEDAFEGQVETLLDGVNSMLASPVMETEQTGSALWIARGSNNSSAVYLWMDAHGNPCPNASALTSRANEATSDPNDFLPCPADAPWPAPGSYATPNASAATLPVLDLVNPQGQGVSAEVGANDDYVNYVLHEQWAMAALDMTIDQAFLGEDAGLTLDTSALSLFIPDLGRADVVPQVPLGSRVAIRMHMLVPPVVEGEQTTQSLYHLKVGDMIWQFVADADKVASNGYEKPLFTTAVSLEVPAQLGLARAAVENQDDKLTVVLGSPVIYSDVTANPLVLNEASVQAAIGNLIRLVLPTIAGTLADVALPGNTARFTHLRVEAPAEDFLVLSGGIIQTINITAPAEGQTVATDPVVLRGTVVGLVNSNAATVNLWLGAATSPRPAGLAQSDANTLSWSVSLAQRDIPAGANEARLVATDGNGQKAYVKFDLNRTGTSVKRVGGSGCGGCGSAGTGPEALLWGLVLAWALRARSRRRAAGRGLPLLAAGLVAAGALSGCGGCGEKPAEPWKPPEFHGAEVDPGAAFVLDSLRIGDKTEGFNVDEDSPDGDPDPDNAIASLGSLANDSLKDAVKEGSLLLLVKVADLKRLPAPGESGQLDLVGFLGRDLDKDPSDNFSGSEEFGIEPASYDESGQPMIRFPRATLSADADGVVTLEGGPAVFVLSIPMGDTLLKLTIDPTRIRATLSPSTLRAGGIDAKAGLLGGVLPASPLARPIEGVPIAPLTLLASSVDVDLNKDGELDKRATEENQDGLSAGIVFTGVPARISEAPLNRPPVVRMQPLPDPVNEPLQRVVGEVSDPDAPCTDTTVELTVNGRAPVKAVVDAACLWSAQVRLAIDRNEIVATATDQGGDSATAKIVTNLEDLEIPTVELTGPEGTIFTQAAQTLTGIARDNVGLLGVEIDVNGTIYAVVAADIAADGSFSLPIVLPKLGENPVTAQAKDLKDHVSAPARKSMVLRDVSAPTVAFTAGRTLTERVDGPGPYALHGHPMLVEGKVGDNAGIAGLTLTFSRERQTLDAPVPDPVTGEFVATVDFELGPHDLTLVARDPSGNETVAEAHVVISDIAGPIIEVLEPALVVDTRDHVLVLRVVDDWDAGARLTVTAALNAAPPAPVPFDQASGTFRLPIALRTGSNALAIAATDASRNTTRLDGVIELADAVPPQLTVTAPTDGAWTYDATTLVVGRATDNFGPLVVSVDVGGQSFSVPPEAFAAFAVPVPLALGPNTITVTARDGANLMAQEERRVERRDPNAVASVAVTVEPGAVALGNDPVRVTATLERLAGGPVPDGTSVSFAADRADLGALDRTAAATIDGRATVFFAPGLLPGVVVLTASAGGLSDTGSLSIAEPTAVAVDVCIADGASMAGASFDLDVDSTTFVAGTPSDSAAEPLDSASDFFAFNSPALPTRVVVAGTHAITGAAGASRIARVTLPIESGLAALADFVLDEPKVADELGATRSGAGLLSVCARTHVLGDLPPLVDLVPIAGPVTQPVHTVVGTVQDADLSTCVAELFVNGLGRSVDISSGTLTTTVTLQPGMNEIRLVVADVNRNAGSDAFAVVYIAPNLPPTIDITQPTTAVTTPTAVVGGPVGDPDDGLAGLTVSVRVNAAPAVAAQVNATAGTWSATVALAAGDNVVRATATDARGAATSASRRVERVEPVVPPVVTIAKPTNNQTVSVALADVEGTVAEGGNPARIAVVLKVNGVEQAVTWSPFSRKFTARVGLVDGANTIAVTATDLTGGSDTDTVVVQMVAPDNPPLVAITAPADGTRTATTSLLVRGTVRDDRPLSTLRSLKVNGTDAVVDNATGDWFVPLPVAPGAQTITATATDARGQTGSASIQVTIFEPPVVVVNYLQIGGPGDGFNVDSTPPHPLSDAAPDNALTGLGAMANGPLQQAVLGADGDPLLLLLEFAGLSQLPTPGQSVTVTINGYMGVDTDGNVADNFSGSEPFQIDPASFDSTGTPYIQFRNVVIRNDFGAYRVDTFPANPASFGLDLSGMSLRVAPAYLRTTLVPSGTDLRLNPGLLGGVVPAAALAVPIEAGGLQVVPLQLILSSDPANPVPDCDLNGDGSVNTTNATAANPDGVSVGLVFTAVPAKITR